MSLKLQVGKRYVDRNNAIVGPMSTVFDNGGGFRFLCEGSGRTYRVDGKYTNADDHPFDLIGQYVEEPLKADLPVEEEQRKQQPSLLHGIVYDALSGSRGPNQQRLAQRGMQVTELLLRKNSDYGESAWTPPVLAPGMTARQAIQCRMSDKVARLQRLLSGAEAEVTDENIDVTMLDLVWYGILWLEAPKK